MSGPVLRTKAEHQGCGRPVEREDLLLSPVRFTRIGSQLKEVEGMSKPERRFVVLKYLSKVPVLASCARCQLKFFTPKTYNRDPLGAEQYLINKFDLHKCEEEPRTSHVIFWPAEKGL
jgi:hypothetical protein